ncbi:YkgJ family cysteine cluster protein [Desulfatitalea tepidiphila]|uniref:YkgJ family cysteine cluster protein n=1 Tax=Desulfatitalea tepidiphila TaxID=1185843 RepID=UPI0006B5B2F5|nr:YkgJ family cysteine cluster protein [Desulfatitalea tepidiphila]
MCPETKTFFETGLSFECKRCGKCCTGAPGTIYAASGEIGPIAGYLGLSVSDLIQGYLYPYKNSFSIKEDDHGNCLFYREGCTIYSVRPHQCRTFPFWFRNVRSESRWREAARQCPGIGHGKRYSKAQIMEIALSTMEI